MARNEKLICGNCEYFECPPDLQVGLCHKGLPDHQGRFRSVARSEWCGEHSQAPNITNIMRRLCDILCQVDVSGGG